MMAKLKEIYKNSSFNPSFWSIFINPYFLLRRGLYKEIRANSKYMKGIMLDLGCGKKPYKNLFDVSSYIGLDIETGVHNHANEQIDVFYDGKTIPFDDHYFDSVFSSEVFEHIFNLAEILDELYRVMKPDAYLLITLPFVWGEHETPYDFARYTSFGIRHLLEMKGFQIIKMTKTANYVETVFQMWNAYVFQFCFPPNIYLKLLLTPFVISPVTMLGIILSKILPWNSSLYHNNIIVAQKGNRSIK